MAINSKFELQNQKTTDIVSVMSESHELVETWSINDRLNAYLLDEVGDDRLSIAPAKGKSVGAQFAHIHNVRLMWLKASFPESLEHVSKLEKSDWTVQEIKENLAASGREIANLIQSAIAAGGRVKGFKPHVTAFVGYLIAHEANHRGQVELALRQAGQPLSDKAGYGLWEWGVR